MPIVKRADGTSYSTDSRGRIKDNFPSDVQRTAPQASTQSQSPNVDSASDVEANLSFSSLEKQFLTALATVDGYREAVAICMLDPQTNRWLQIRRAYDNKGGGQIGFAGGKVDKGETQEEALVREASEELGIDVVPGHCFGFVDLPEWNIRMNVWTVDYHSGPYSPSPREVHELLWLTDEEMRDNHDSLRSSALILDLLHHR